jgi:hypothetical protein
MNFRKCFGTATGFIEKAFICMLVERILAKYTIPFGSQNDISFEEDVCTKLPSIH